MMKKSLNDDLVSLANLDERSVLEELKNRFLKNQIYVSINMCLCVCVERNTHGNII
jgi:myosin heavy subunit